MSVWLLLIEKVWLVMKFVVGEVRKCIILVMFVGEFWWCSGVSEW